MSVSSNIRKESTESNAAQQMHSTMGIDPSLSQLNDKDLDNELPSRLNDRANGTTVAEDVEEIEATVEHADQPGGTVHVNDADWNRTTQD